jgi:glycosyltransferase involved in cell wall biosynthesis
VPVVATAVGGVPEIATDGETALLVKPADAHALADAMARLLADAQLGFRLADRARQLARQRYTPEGRTRRLVGIYRGVVA